jgi:hypothetical protein
MDKLGIHAFDVGQHEELLNGGVVADVAVKLRISVAPLSGRLAEEGNVEDVGFAGVGNGGLRRSDLRRDEVGL